MVSSLVFAGSHVLLFVNEKMLVVLDQVQFMRKERVVNEKFLNMLPSVELDLFIKTSRVEMSSFIPVIFSDLSPGLSGLQDLIW